MMGRRVFISAAEVSGDRHAAQLVLALRRLDPTLVIEGLGGPEMAEAGATVHRETVSRAAMGFRGALRALEVSRVLKWTGRHFEKFPPDVVIGVDSPSMNFHFARLAKSRGIPVLQYVAPQLWAWREGRMKKVRKWIDHLACILPFEQDYFRSHGVNATFVGHPLFDELPPQRERPVNDAAPPEIVGLLPGSRKSEAQANFPRFLRVAAELSRRFAPLRFLVPTTAATHDVVRGAVEALPLGSTLRQAITFAQDAFDEMVPHCDLCLTVSGTATLHVAGFGVPMIVVYAGNPIVWNLVGRWIIKTRTFALVNVLAAGPGASSDQHVVPEFIPWYGPVDSVVDLATEFLTQPPKLAAQRQRLAALVGTLDHPGASDHVARLAVEMMNQPSEPFRINPAGNEPHLSCAILREQAS